MNKIKRIKSNLKVIRNNESEARIESVYNKLFTIAFNNIKYRKNGINN